TASSRETAHERTTAWCFAMTERWTRKRQIRCGGRWQVPWAVREEAWYRIEVQYCEVTGQLLPRRYWEFEYEGRVIKACDPRCEALFHEYVVNRPGTETAGRPSGS